MASKSGRVPRRLTKAQSELVLQLQRLQRQLSESNPDPDENDFSSATSERMLLQGQVDLHQLKLAKVRIAVERAQRRLYGVCAGCGGQIEHGRLKLLVETILCCACAKASAKAANGCKG